MSKPKIMGEHTYKRKHKHQQQIPGINKHWLLISQYQLSEFTNKKDTD